jgi:hypothetical protein
MIVAGVQTGRLGMSRWLFRVRFGKSIQIRLVGVLELERVVVRTSLEEQEKKSEIEPCRDSNWDSCGSTFMGKMKINTFVGDLSWMRVSAVDKQIANYSETSLLTSWNYREFSTVYLRFFVLYNRTFYVNNLLKVAFFKLSQILPIFAR